MMAIGLLMLLGGGCFLACGFVLNAAQLTPDQMAKVHQLELQFHASTKEIFATMGIVVAVAGIYHVGVGFFVRRAMRWAIYTAIVTTIGALGLFGLDIMGGVAFGGADAIAGICVLVVIGSIFIWLFLWLFSALRGLSASGAAAAQYQAQYWQMLQQQQAYAQQPGMPVPPPPGAFGPPPPPQPPSPEPTGWAYGQQTPPPPPPSSP
jgi:uncharacterized membrane protein (DUF2068 family)